MKMIRRFKASFNQYRKYFKIDTHFGFEDARKNYFDTMERKTYEIRLMKEIDVKEGEMDAIRTVCKNWKLD